MKNNKINITELDLSKLWLSLFLIFLLFLAFLLWSIKNQEVVEFLILHPIVILPYLIDKLGMFKILLGMLIMVGYIPLIIALPSGKRPKKSVVIRGTQVMKNKELKLLMQNKCLEEIEKQLKDTNQKITKRKRKTLAKEIFARNKEEYIEITDITIPKSLENTGFFFFGDPGTGKSESIKRAISALKARSDFRGMIFDRNGEMLNHFYNPEKDIIYNPFDARSIDWCHTYEKGVNPETIAKSLIPPDLTNQQNNYFQTAAAAIVGEIYRKAKNNEQVYQMLLKPDEEIISLLKDTIAYRYVSHPKAAGNNISTANNYCQFYKYIHQPKQDKISFFNWALNDDPRWIFITLRENEAAVLKPLHTLVFELILKGLISNQKRNLKTAIVIDELGALNKLSSLRRLLSEGRKFKGCPILGTQTQAQMTQIYGKEETSILLQGALTKLILRCSDPDTADMMSRQIGECEVLRYKENESKTAATFKSPASKTKSTVQDYNKSAAVLPSEIQNQPNYHGYLKIGGLISDAVTSEGKYPDKHPNFIPIEDNENNSSVGLKK